MNLNEIIRKANQDDPVAQFSLFEIYMEDQLAQTDYDKALEWLRNAAQQSFAPAQTQLGLFTGPAF